MPNEQEGSNRTEIHMKVPSRIHELVKRAAKLDPDYGTAWRVYAAGAEALAQKIISEHEQGGTQKRAWHGDGRDWRWMGVNVVCPSCSGAVEAYFYDEDLPLYPHWKGALVRCKECEMTGALGDCDKHAGIFDVRWR